MPKAGVLLSLFQDSVHAKGWGACPMLTIYSIHAEGWGAASTFRIYVATMPKAGVQHQLLRI